MKSVEFISDVQATLGALGYSVLERQWDGKPERKTLLFLRNNDGWPQACVIAPAENLAEVIY